MMFPRLEQRKSADEEKVEQLFRDELTATWEDKVACQNMEVEESKVWLYNTTKSALDQGA